METCYSPHINTMSDAISEIDYLQNEGAIIKQSELDKIRKMHEYLGTMLNTMEAFGQIDNEHVGKLDFSKIPTQ